MSWLKEKSLDGENIFLIPMEESHVDALSHAASDGKLWELWFTQVPSKENTEAYVQKALNDKKDGTCLPFVIINKLTGKIIGSTRICHASEKHRRIEIGYSWIANSFQKTEANTESKFLLLSYAFEELKTIAVEFRTHFHNRGSRMAIERLGARQDGVLRNHQIMPDGSYRDSVVYSIIESEWPAVKAGLVFHINRG